MTYSVLPQLLNLTQGAEFRGSERLRQIRVVNLPSTMRMRDNMSHAPCFSKKPPGEALPLELVELRERVKAQPSDVRAELEPLLEDVLEHARFRNRIMSVARDALERLQLDLEVARFDLDATRREREDLRRRLNEQIDD
jgi:hypothetical protein